MENILERGMRVVVQDKGYGHPAHWFPAMEKYVGVEFEVYKVGGGLLGEGFIDLRNCFHLVHYSFLKDVTCVPKVGDRIRTREEYKAAALKECGIEIPDTESFDVLTVKNTLNDAVLVNDDMRINRDGTSPYLQGGITVFEYVNQPTHLAINNPGLYCSCGGPTKQVPTGITPASGFYTICSLCRKERL